MSELWIIRQCCLIHDDVVEESMDEGADIPIQYGTLLLPKHGRYERMIKKILSTATVLQMCNMKAVDCRET